MNKVYMFFVLFLLVIGLYAQDLQLTILQTNDQHGHFLPFNIVGQQQIGGVAARMTLFNQVRQEVLAKQGQLLLLDCGDVNTGEPYSDVLMAEPDIKLMNALGYQAMAVGNHEFDLTLDNLILQQTWANFPYLSANVFYTETRTRMFKPFIIFEVGGLKVGVFGMTPFHTPGLSTNGKSSRFYFEKPETVLPDLLQEMRSQCDFIIGLFHVDHELAVVLAEQFQEIDLIIGGHTHLPMMQAKKIGKTLLAEAGYYGMMVGRFDLVFQEKKLKDWKYELIGINLSQPIQDESGNILCNVYPKRFEEDPEIAKLAMEYFKRTEDMFKELLGVATDDIPKSLDGLPSSALGNLICDAIREQTKTDVAFQNVGGIRSNILKGNIYEHDLRRILPFLNTIVIYSLRGEQIKELMGKMVENREFAKAMLEISGAVVYVQGTKIENIEIGGKPIEFDKVYQVAVNSFIAKGGDGYEMLARWITQSHDTGMSISTIVKEYIKKNSPLVPNNDKRLIFKN